MCRLYHRHLFPNNRTTSLTLIPKYRDCEHFAQSDEVHTLFNSELSVLEIWYPKLFKDHELFSVRE
jgi:hypothetical protein